MGTLQGIELFKLGKKLLAVLCWVTDSFVIPLLRIRRVRFGMTAVYRVSRKQGSGPE